MTSVAVCIATFRRPAYLAQLLESLTRLERDGLLMRVLVVDNDTGASARTVVEGFRAWFSDLLYQVEPERGIAAVRNRLVSIAKQCDLDYLVFLDDDEWADPRWLSHLVGAAVEHSADVVAAPVLPRYDEAVPAWVTEIGMYEERPRRATGTPLNRRTSQGTGNCLFRCALLAKFAGPFDHRFALSGGEDHHLIQRILRTGVTAIWCDEAVVYEHIPASRATVRWFLKRQFNYGIHGSRVVRLLEPGFLPRAEQVGRASARLTQGLALLPLALVRGRVATLRACRHCARGLGGLVGMAGYTYHEYKQIHGR